MEKLKNYKISISKCGDREVIRGKKKKHNIKNEKEKYIYKSQLENSDSNPKNSHKRCEYSPVYSINPPKYRRYGFKPRIQH